MSSLPSSSETPPGFELLDQRIQRWIWEKGWTGLRDAQERAIAPILEGKRDVIIAAATAAGKTEAAFLPILTRLASLDEESGLAVYISPLKALINDQWGRLDQLCERLEIPTIPWHGDIPASRKQKFLRQPRGVLLITPESVEALFARRGSEVGRLFSAANYLVIDELHAFIGSDRGKQMQSLLCRIEHAAQVRIPRIGLSATLGDMGLASDYLRPGEGSAVAMVVSQSAGQDLRIQIRGYLVPAHAVDADAQEIVDSADVASRQVAQHLYKTLRGSNNLVFPNSRRQVEYYADALRAQCDADGVPNEFWPHHGSLSRAIREETEHALKEGSRPATAICTSTLELGIDIGAVKSVAQVGPAPAVASLRQRLGRSGRRAGEPAILRTYVVENELTARSPLSDRLRETLMQSIAMTELLLSGWFEPPSAQGLHASTLVQQVLSLISERGGITAATGFQDLVGLGAFMGLTQNEFGQLLRAMAANDLIVQDPTGLLLLGERGERLVAGYDFYAAFPSDDEWQIVCDGQMLGTLPIHSPVQLGNRIVFAGRRWQITGIDESTFVLSVCADPGGLPPRFDSGRPSAHDVIRQRMREVLQGTATFPYLDETAARLLSEARQHYHALDLDRHQILTTGADTQILSWKGDAANDALALLLGGLGFAGAENHGLTIDVHNVEQDRLMDGISDIADLENADLEDLLTDVYNMRRGKWDWTLPLALLRRSFASSCLSIAGAREIARSCMASDNDA